MESYYELNSLKLTLIYPQYKLPKGKIHQMEVVTWSELQVRRNLAAFGTVETTGSPSIRKRKQKLLTLENENGDTFECPFDMDGTIPGGATLELLTELSECATNLNEFENDDVEVDNITHKIIRMVSIKCIESKSNIKEIKKENKFK